MRPRAVLLALLAAAACAHVEAPTGGPEDKDAPRVLVTRPDSLAVVGRWDAPVVFVFNERLSEQQVEESVMVSPRTSPVEVSHRGDEIRVNLRRGWQPGVIYHVTLRPVLQDLFNNRLPAPVQVVFSTGPAIPATGVAGAVFDRVTARPDTSVRVEAIRLADSLVYAVPTDTAGRFVIARVPAGEYRIRAFRDANRNRALDPFEPRDSVPATLAVGETPPVRLSVVAPDSTPPRIASSALAGERRVEVRFDDYLDPDQPLSAGNVQVLGPDGAAVPVRGVAVAQAASADTTSARPRIPAQVLTVDLAPSARLVPGGKYRVLVRGVRNLVGLAGSAEGEFTAPATPPSARSDTTGVRPRAALPAGSRTRTRIDHG